MGGIVWLASYPKSGNTWIRTFLHNLHFDPAKPFDINMISSLTYGDGGKTWYEKASGKPFDELTPQQVARLTPTVHMAFANMRPGPVFVKTHSAVGSLHNVPLITMECTIGAVYIVRNPLDIAVSMASHYDMDLDESIDMLNNPRATARGSEGKVAQIYGSWTSHVGSWQEQRGAKMLTLRYEDLLTKPRKTFSALTHFLQLKHSRKQLEKAIKFSSFDNLKKQELEKGFKERPNDKDLFFRVGKAGQWKELLSDDQKNRVIDCHQHMMKEFGYLPK
ncbi:sulfotransferase domain-containing protein [Sneathiella marina]|uniref:Sulfotransferase domain-containing protein n=1 Tax=Sneathiella marina TaxID=2950108 RepID=A0ABY4W3E9_9PROT|nr:sulfotransferase domain-containing protein [Sneathiella marina]USG61434.1 sulfotransferase domain-containing protein [Sneathiella marina]